MLSVIKGEKSQLKIIVAHSKQHMNSSFIRQSPSMAPEASDRIPTAPKVRYVHMTLPTPSHISGLTAYINLLLVPFPMHLRCLNSSLYRPVPNILSTLSPASRYRSLSSTPQLRMTAEEVPPKQIGVGVGVFVLNAARTHFVIGKRVGSVGSGKVSFVRSYLNSPSHPLRFSC